MTALRKTDSRLERAEIRPEVTPLMEACAEDGLANPPRARGADIPPGPFEIFAYRRCTVDPDAAAVLSLALSILRDIGVPNFFRCARRAAAPAAECQRAPSSLRPGSGKRVFAPEESNPLAANQR